MCIHRYQAHSCRVLENSRMQPKASSSHVQDTAYCQKACWRLLNDTSGLVASDFTTWGIQYLGRVPWIPWGPCTSAWTILLKRPDVDWTVWTFIEGILEEMFKENHTSCFIHNHTQYIYLIYKCTSIQISWREVKQSKKSPKYYSIIFPFIH